MDNNGGAKYICLDEFIKNEFVIPAFQRNYVWKSEDAKIVVAKMLKGWSDKKEKDTTLGMITVFKSESTNKYEIIDGQQRIITIKLLFQWLNYCLEEKERIKIDLEFERDNKCNNDKKRINFINNLTPKGDFFEEDCFSIDTIRFCRNYNAIGEIIVDDNKKTIKDIVKDNGTEIIHGLMKKIRSIKLIVHITTENPNAEFLNINSKKNRFSLADYAKSYMIINEDKKKGGVNSIVELYKNLSMDLYNDEYWNVLKINYDEDMKKSKDLMENGVENRMDCLFIDRYDKKNIADLIDSSDNESIKLKIFDIRINKLFNSNSAYNSFLWMAKNKKRKFFELILCENDYIRADIDIKKILIKEASKIADIQELNSFLEIQLTNNRLQYDELKNVEIIKNNNFYYGELLKAKEVQEKILEQYNLKEV